MQTNSYPFPVIHGTFATVSTCDGYHYHVAAAKSSCIFVIRDTTIDQSDRKNTGSHPTTANYRV